MTYQPEKCPTRTDQEILSGQNNTRPKKKQKEFIEVTKSKEKYLFNSKAIRLRNHEGVCEIYALHSDEVLCMPNESYEQIKAWLLEGQTL